MLIAVCFSTQLRGGIQAYKNIKNYLGDAYGSCTFFAHLWDINTRKPYTRSGPNQLPEIMHVDSNEIEEWKALYPITSCKVENFEYAKKLHTDHGFHFDPIYYSWYQSLELMNDFALTTGYKFDLVVKLRPDVLFHPRRKFTTEIFEGYIKNTQDTFFVETLLEDWKTANWMNDVYWVSKPGIMDMAKNFYFEQREKQKDLHQQYSLLKYLRRNNVPLANIGHDMACAKLECIKYDTVTEYQKCYDCEKYYFQPIEFNPNLTLPEINNEQTS